MDTNGNNDSPQGAEQLLHEAFASVVRQGPGRVAVTGPDGICLTYAELDSRAEELAARLRACGTEAGELVGLCADRSADLLVGLLGILKAGGAYVPLDPAYPAARTQMLLEDTKVRTVVAVSRTAHVLSGREVRLVLVDEPRQVPGAPAAAGPSRDVGADSPAYVIHTSGSTGEPKGVVVEHRNAMRLFTTSRELFGIGPDDVWTLFHSVSFDFSVWEIWGALLHGGRLVIVPEDAVRRPQEFLALLEREQVTVVSQTPTAFRALAGCEAQAAKPARLALRLIVFGGERIDVAFLRPWIERHGDARPQLVNMYGITETTVHVTHRRIVAADLEHPEQSPIGVPLPDLRVRLVDGAGRPVEPGTPGEIQVAGPGVARGYLGKEGLTAERFVDGPDGRWYRSGDRAVQTPDGELLHLGRVDDQIKVRGYRIEPGEVEHCLAGHPQVSAAVVTAGDFDGDVRLVAYVLPADPRDPAVADLPGELSALVRDRLPAHLRPSVYRLLERLPRTPQGKTDRAALDDCLLAGLPTGGPTQPEAGGREAVVRRIVEDVLERTDLESGDDIFAAGATSLSFARILARLQREFGVPVDIASLGDDASIRGLAAALAEAPAASDPMTTGAAA